MDSKDNKIKSITKLRLKKSFVGLFFAILAFLSYELLYLFILFAALSIIFAIFGFFDKTKVSIIVSILSFILGISSILLYFLYYKPNFADPNMSVNVMLGTWEYNDSGGTYIFNENKTYYQYATKDKKDNYCTGTYKYSFGYESENDGVIYGDTDYYYYNLILKPEYCIVTGKKELNTKKEYNKTMAFGYNKYDFIQPVLINVKTDNNSILKKVK